jgi:hypothetical protein
LESSEFSTLVVFAFQFGSGPKLKAKAEKILFDVVLVRLLALSDLFL